MNPYKFLGFAHEFEKIALDVDPVMLSALLGTVPGAAIGYTQTRDPNKRLRNTLLGGAGGALAGYGLGSALFNDPETVAQTRDWNKLVGARNAVTDRLSDLRGKAGSAAVGKSMAAGHAWHAAGDQAQQVSDALAKSERLSRAMDYIKKNRDVVTRVGPEALARARALSLGSAMPEDVPAAMPLPAETAQRAQELGEQLSNAGSVAADMEMPVTIQGGSPLLQALEGIRNRRWAGSTDPLSVARSWGE